MGEITGVDLKALTNSLTNIKTILDDAGADHVATQGCHTREVYYEKPALRPAEDIDILISPRDKRDYGWRKAEALGVRR